MKSIKVAQVFLALLLAAGLTLSPLQSAAVGYGARLLDETPSVQIEDQIQETGTEEENIESSPQPAETEISVTDESISTPQTDVATEPVSPPSETTPGPSPAEDTLIPTPDNSPLIETTVVTEQAIEPTSIPIELSSETPSPLSTETTAHSFETTPTPEPTVVEEPRLAEDEPLMEVVDESSSMVKGKILVQYDTSENLEEILSKMNLLGFSDVEAGDDGILVLDVPPGSEIDSAVLIESLAGIQSAAPMLEATALDIIPNDPEFANQPYLTMIDAAGGWDYTTGSGNVIIAVIDTGVNYTNLDLSGRLVGGYDFVNNDYDPFDDNGHGTHVAGIIAATGNNGNGIAGLDWQAKIMPIKVLDASGSGSDLNVYYGILYAVDNGASIINLSLALDSYSALVAAAVDYANSRGVTVVAASGNTNSTVNYPAALPQVIAVGAVDNSENRAFYSNYGSALDVVAPGNNVLSTEGSGLNYRTGTSMAAPQVTGLASLLKSIRPMTPAQIKTTIETTSKDLGANGWDQYFGNGLIQVRHAIEWLMGRLKAASSRPDSEEDAPPAIVYPTFTPTITPTFTPTVTPSQIPS